MSSTSKAWMVAASIAAVEALKDQGFCRWNYSLRSLNQCAKTHVRSVSLQANKNKLSISPSAAAAIISSKLKEDKARQSEESLKKVMYLSCWGPY